MDQSNAVTTIIYHGRLCDALSQHLIKQNHEKQPPISPVQRKTSILHLFLQNSVRVQPETASLGRMEGEQCGMRPFHVHFKFTKM